MVSYQLRMMVGKTPTNPSPRPSTYPIGERVAKGWVRVGFVKPVYSQSWYQAGSRPLLECQ